MAIKLENEKMIPAVALDKVHVISWLQTEETNSPYLIRVQAKVILYGHDENGDRVYDPDGASHINVKDWRAMLGTHLTEVEPATAAEVMGMQVNYVKALAYMISLTTEYGQVTY